MQLQSHLSRPVYNALIDAACQHFKRHSRQDVERLVDLSSAFTSCIVRPQQTSTLMSFKQFQAAGSTNQRAVQTIYAAMSELVLGIAWRAEQFDDRRPFLAAAVMPFPQDATAKRVMGLWVFEPLQGEEFARAVEVLRRKAPMTITAFEVTRIGEACSKLQTAIVQSKILPASLHSFLAI